MKKIIVTLCVVGAMAGCSTTTDTSLQSKYSNYLDLTSEFKADATESHSNKLWKVTSRQHPKFPDAALNGTKSGCVVVDIAINANGQLEDYAVKESFPKGLFDKSTVNALKDWQWEATAMNRNKQQVISRVQVDFDFTNPITNKTVSQDARTTSVCKNYRSTLVGS